MLDNCTNAVPNTSGYAHVTDSTGQCPCCGYCPTCGRKNGWGYPYPIWPTPTWICNDTPTVSFT